MATITMGMTSTPLTATKTWTGSDADMQAILDWAVVAFNPWIQAQFNPTKNPAFVPTNAQIGAAIANSWMQGVKDAVQRFKTQPPIPPAPITFS